MRIELRWKNEAGIRDRAPLSDAKSRARSRTDPHSCLQRNNVYQWVVKLTVLLFGRLAPSYKPRDLRV